MTTDIRKDPRKAFVPRYWPWILALVMLGVYWATLDRWVSFRNLDYVAKVSGWTWQPEVFNPVLFLVTYPLRWLPAAQVPLALNVLSAVCAALTLGLLARSVTLLPQDRTDAQRLRETSDFSFLTARTAWLPPLLAVLVCGLQFTFWENATVFTGETIDLLAFAFTIWSLLEYRLDEQDWRLMLAMVVYGADMTESAGAIGFLPFLLGALIWIRGLSFFNARFLGRMAVCGLAGTSLYLLLPTLAVLSGKLPANLWWLILKINWAAQWHPIKLFFSVSDFRHDLGLISLTTLFPVILIAFRWGAGFGDRSRLGTALTGFMFHLVFGLILFICVWVSFDPPFSPRHLNSQVPTASFLSFYYLAALAVGYYSGYFLLVCRVIVLKNSRRRPAAYKLILQPVIITGVVLLTLLAPAGLIYKNGPLIRSVNSGALKHYARLAASCLPATGGILLSDSESGQADAPRRLYLVQAVLAQAGREKEYVPVDTFSLDEPIYHRYLHKKYPDRWPLLVDPKTTSLLNPHGLLGMLAMLEKTNAIYYLHPSFGYYFEAFYLEPHGLVYQLKRLPEDTLIPRPVDGMTKAENETFWKQAEAEAFAPIIGDLTPVNPFNSHQTLMEKVMAGMHVQPEANYNSMLAGMYYSRSLDFWGAELQRVHDLTNAAACFKKAQALNPDNLVAGINLDFNQKLQTGQPVPMDLSKASPDQFGKYRSWEQIMTANGPFDEPSFCFVEGLNYFQGAFVNEALATFARTHELEPEFLPAMLWMGELYVFDHHPRQALEVLQEPLAHPEKFSLNDENSTELNILAATAFIQQTNLAHGVRLIEKEIAHHPDNDELLTTAAQVYLVQGLYTNALHVIHLKLSATPNDPVWLGHLGYVHMRMHDYEAAIDPLSRVLSVQTTNNNARFNRAIAFLNTGNFQAARDDYQELLKALPNSYQVAYGLGEVAWRQHATNEAINAYTLYLANAPTNSAEAKMISQRLASLKGNSP